MKIFFVINGGRALVSPALVSRLRTILDEARANYRLEISQSLEHSNQLVAEASAGGYDTLWMGGGDGTIHVLLNQAMPAHMNLGVVPMGTVNALARALGIPMQPAEAVRFLLKASPRPMNIGCVNDTRRFLCFAGVGFDAAVVHDVGGAFNRIGGRVAYAAAGAMSVFALKRIVPFDLEFVGRDAGSVPHGTIAIQPDDLPTKDHGYSLVLSNIRNYAGFNLFPDAHPCADAMEMWVFRHRRIDAMALWTAATMFGWKSWQRHMRSDVGHYLVQSFTVTSERPLYLQLDGEAVLLGDGTRYEFEFCREAVNVLM
jgi:diacylglycerol kinase family enzyme